MCDVGSYTMCVCVCVVRSFVCVFAFVCAFGLGALFLYIYTIYLVYPREAFFFREVFSLISVLRAVLELLVQSF